MIGHISIIFFIFDKFFLRKTDPLYHKEGLFSKNNSIKML